VFTGMLDQHLLMTIENFVLYVTCGRFFQIRVPPEIEMLSMTFFCDRSRVGVNQCGFQGSFLACDPVEEITVRPSLYLQKKTSIHKATTSQEGTLPCSILPT